MDSVSLQALRTSHKPSNAEVIVVSSDDEDVPVPRKHRVPNKVTRRTKRPPAETEEVVEISSDGESSLLKEIRKLKEENSRLRRAQRQTHKETASVAPTAQEITKIRELAAQDKKKLLSTLEEQISCEICTSKMWAPFALQCGHTFCQRCLQDWFSTCQAQYMQSNPNYDPNPPHIQQLRMLAQSPMINQHQRQHHERQIAMLMLDRPRPNYHCPSCRSPVKSRPSEAYALKSIVRIVADAMGESSPRESAHAGLTTLHGNVWDGFFP